MPRIHKGWKPHWDHPTISTRTHADDFHHGAGTIRRTPNDAMIQPKESDAWHPKYRPDIDGLRAIAILSVLSYHADPSWLRGGFSGVDVFFVISGYLITLIVSTNLEADRFQFRDFYFRRVARIFPALLVVLLACYAVGWWNLVDVEYKELGKEIAAASGFVANLVLWNETGYFDAAARTKPLLHLWSLGVEEQFYLFWPLALWWARRLRWRASHVAIGIGLASFATNLWVVRHAPAADFYSPLTRFWELMAGGWLALRHHESGTSGRVGSLLGPLGAALILGSIVLLRHQGFPGWKAIFPVVGAMSLIAAGADGWINRHVLAHRALVRIGLISFSLYLWHWPLLVFAYAIHGSWPHGTVLGGLLTGSFLLAWVTYALVETPMRRPLRRGRVVAWTAVAMVLTGFIGYKTYTRNGLTFRLDAMAEKFVTVEDSGKTMAAWRDDACFLEHEGQHFATQCLEPGNLPLVVLWGDSHAAQFYPGLHSLQKTYPFRIAQYTTSGCVPFVNAPDPRPLCHRDNAAALSAMAKVRPALVLLSASWTMANLGQLPETVRDLRRAGVHRIAVIGPTPVWTQLLSKLYFLYWRQNHQILPRRSRFGVAEDVAPVDTAARQLADRLNLVYLSPFDALCNTNGCDTRIGPGRGVITTFDDSHLTLSVSNRLMRQFAPTLFGPPPK